MGKPKCDRWEIDADIEHRRAVMWAENYVIGIASGMKRGEAYKKACSVLGLAGSPSTVSKFISNPVVKSEVARLLAEVQKKYKKTADDILSELGEIAYSDIGDFFERVPGSEGESDGLQLKHLLDLGNQRKAIKTIKHKVRTIRSKQEGIVETIHEYEYELWDKMSALRVLSEFHRIINAPKDNTPQNQTHVHVYLPDNGFGGGTPVQAQFGNSRDNNLPELPAPPLQIEDGTLEEVVVEEKFDDI